MLRFYKSKDRLDRKKRMILSTPSKWLELKKHTPMVKLKICYKRKLNWRVKNSS